MQRRLEYAGLFFLPSDTYFLLVEIYCVPNHVVVILLNNVVSFMLYIYPYLLSLMAWCQHISLYQCLQGPIIRYCFDNTFSSQDYSANGVAEERES